MTVNEDLASCQTHGDREWRSCSTEGARRPVERQVIAKKWSSHLPVVVCKESRHFSYNRRWLPAVRAAAVRAACIAVTVSEKTSLACTFHLLPLCGFFSYFNANTRKNTQDVCGWERNDKRLVEGERKKSFADRDRRRPEGERKLSRFCAQ